MVEAIPVPERGTVEVPTLVTMLIVALTVPSVTGLNVTVRGKLWDRRSMVPLLQPLTDNTLEPVVMF